jgi:iron complex outermembrane receptor protein
MRLNCLLATTAMTVVSGLFAVTAANAEQAPAPSPALTEVVVTARARAEKLIQVPISVQAFTATKLAADNIVNLNTLQFEAGFTFNSQGASYSGGGREFPTLIFRGMSSNYGGASGGSSGALFVDGIYISGGAASVTLADASQVEVLKGPQNVYFGKNTFGGAVNLITSNPSEDYHAKASVGYSYKGSYDDVASVEGAIIPGILTGRVTGELFHQGAQYKAADGGPLGEQDTKGVTVVLYATPVKEVWLRTRFHYSHDDDSTAADGYLDGSVYGTACPGLTNPYFCNGIPTLSKLSPQQVLSGTVMPQSLLTAIATDNFGGGATQEWLNKVPTIDHSGLARDNLQGSIAGGVSLPFDTTFQFSAGYNQATALDLTAADHTAGPFFITNTATINRDFEADARILTSASQPLRGVLGVNYFQSVNELSQGGSFFGFISPQFATPIDENDETEAVYGSLEYDILHNLTVTGEFRYQRDTISDAVDGGIASKTYDHALPRVILRYQPTPETNVYVSYSEGVQPPQLQTSYVAASIAALTGPSYEKDALAAAGATSDYTDDPTDRVWEVGWKQSLFDGRVYFNVDYYNEFWDHALVNTFLFDPAGCTTTYGHVYPVNTHPDCPLGSSGQFVTNPSNNHIQGIEFEGSARITSQWTTHMTFNWTDAFRTSYYDNSWGGAFTSGNVPSQNGKRIDLVPEFQASFDSTYRDHLIADYDWYAHGMVTYTSEQYVEATDIAKINGYFRVNLSAGITKGNLTFEAFVTNLLDDKNWDAAVRFPEHDFNFTEAYQGVIASAPNPRDFGFKLSAKF